MAQGSDVLITLLSDWRMVVGLIVLIAAIGEARVRLQRLVELHKPEDMIKRAQERGQRVADFKTAQQDIVAVTDRVVTLEKKLSSEIKDVYREIKNGRS